MKHYSYSEWIFYKGGILPGGKLQEMEDHLYICDDCMEIFLSLIDQKEIDKTSEYITQDFTNKIRGSIGNLQQTNSQIGKNNNQFIDIFIYYIAVATVAIAFTIGGVYSSLVDIFPKVNQLTIQDKKFNTPNIVMDISSRVVESTSNLISNFEITNYKEDSK